MPRLAPKPLSLKETQREELQKLVNRHSTPQQVVKRARIILLADEGNNHTAIAQSLNISRDMARLWRNRWLELEPKDNPCRGTIARCSTTRKSNDLQLRANSPVICDGLRTSRKLPASNQSLDTERISRRIGQTRYCQKHLSTSCGAIIRRSNAQTSSVKLLAQSPPDPELEEKVKGICQIYLNAQQRAEVGERTISIDEMTGIQALERKAPNLPMRPGKPERQEFEYIRHGTQTLIASFDVARGEVVTAHVGDTRTEADYLEHIKISWLPPPIPPNGIW
ncbi:helix-turn-helix domain-containing protein [Lusitaniella coriacea]|uniref:helix-turn-helix domain-containing protein n=1 Tax=Lusitaniella coriacea TaxID=1983105 RepID=UPI003CEEB3BA